MQLMYNLLQGVDSKLSFQVKVINEPFFFCKPISCNSPDQSVGDFPTKSFTPRERMKIKNCSALFIHTISHKNCFFLSRITNVSTDLSANFIKAQILT